MGVDRKVMGHVQAALVIDFDVICHGSTTEQQCREKIQNLFHDAFLVSETTLLLQGSCQHEKAFNFNMILKLNDGKEGEIDHFLAKKERPSLS